MLRKYPGCGAFLLRNLFYINGLYGVTIARNILLLISMILFLKWHTIYKFLANNFCLLKI
jgi:hypothetical protein